MEFDMSTNQQIVAAPGYSAPVPKVKVKEPEKPVPMANTQPIPQEKAVFDIFSDRNELEKVRVRQDRASIDEIERIIASANKQVAPLFVEFQYQIHDGTNHLIVSMINSNTGEVIREIPPERSLDALVKIKELLGIMIDELS